MRKISILSSVISVIDGIIAVLVLTISGLFGFLGIGLITDSGAHSGEIMAGVFSIFVLAFGIFETIFFAISPIVGLTTKRKARKYTKIGRNPIDAYMTDAIVKVGINGFSLLIAIFGLISNIRDGYYQIIPVYGFIFTLGALSVWLFIEVILYKKNIELNQSLSK